ncbi:MAG: DUF6265 family protein [Chryseobacterium sp.]|jgi:hypothetical protein|uniref:DUF6265 family protein n=1 Tax=Chryseobacterium sp. TaxID=1871047 RepID=UPI00282E8AE4|nr:DUF6265 family protein [Chryseobacterium sp.]MDR2236112.1 DUF6265 family protein [Chryseobacterium sp.]
MKNSLLIVSAALLVLSCNQSAKTNQNSPEAQPEKVNTANFDWLAGKWKRSNEQAGKETFENWNKISPTEYSGIGFTLQKGDTINQETMKLVNHNGEWSLLVKTPEEKQPTEFRMTEMKNNEFVCINDSLDFPKRIQYQSEGKKLKAVISNEKMKIPFEFEKSE